METKKANMARIELGRMGEQLAVEKLVVCGYTIRERNFRCRCGEIDIVAEHEQDLVFIEVKTRRGTARGMPEEAINKKKQRKIVQVAEYYLKKHGAIDSSWRVDVVAVQMRTNGQLEEIRVYQHAVYDVP